jgi:predicted short-subunit dehydrogenase-like oxidoreductase (DUF2520 family)
LANAAARVIGPGRAGRSLALALGRVGWSVDVLGRDEPARDAARGVDLVVVAVPDHAIAEVAAGVDPGPAVVCHLSGAHGLDVLGPHARRASLHPLASLPDPEIGARRLLDRCPFAVAGDPLAHRVVSDLGGRVIEVAEDRRALYHAAAAVAANHVVALAAQVERLAAAAGVPVDAYWPLARGAIDDVARVGSARSLTGPAARGDDATVRAHLGALPPGEGPLYRTLAREAARLADRTLACLAEEPVP